MSFSWYNYIKLKMVATNSWFYCRLGWGHETQQH